jgi:hypothetical protein
MGAVYIPHRTARPAAVAQKPAVAAAGPGRRTSVVLAFLPTGSGAQRLPGEPAGSDAEFESELASVPGMSVGIMSATQGAYMTEQFLLDLTQGARIASSAYPTPRPPALSLQAIGAGAVVSGWSAARRRAEDGRSPNCRWAARPRCYRASRRSTSAGGCSWSISQVGFRATATCAHSARGAARESF